MSKKEVKKDYSQNADSLHGLTEREKVRTKMGMYAGGSGQEALHVLIREPNDNSIDEWNYLHSHPEEKSFEKIKITIDTKEMLCSVRDYGRGIPYVKDKEGMSVLEKAVSILHMGGKHDNNSEHLLKEKITTSTGNYSFSSGINGVGITLTNYASDLFFAIVFNEKNNEKAYIVYENGYKKEFKLVGLKDKIDIFPPEIKSEVLNNDILNKDLKTGTLIVFKPSIKEDAFDDEGVFDEDVVFDKEMVIQQLKTLPYLNPGLKIELNFDGETILFEERQSFAQIIEDEAKHKLMTDTVYLKEHMVFAQNRTNKSSKVYSIDDFVKLPYSTRRNFKVKETIFELAFNFVEGSEVPFQENNVNGSIIIQGGKQDIVLKNKILHYINKYVAENYKSIGKFEKDDIMNNFSFMFQVKINEPKFAGQTKNKLDNSELTQFSNYFFNKHLKYWINREDKNKMRKIIQIFEANRKARLQSNKIKEDVFKEVLSKSDDALLLNTGKLTKCKSKDPEKCELYIVEGDSAGGGAKIAGIREYQAILPLKGKPLNALKDKNIRKIFTNDEIINLITALECGIGKDFDISKIRYHKVCTLTDADVDGKHINSLLLSFFYKYMRPLIEAGYVYVAVAPLFHIKTSKKTYYAWSIKEKDDILKKIKGKATVGRFKGLGEMEPDILYDTTLNKKNRKLIKVTLEDFDESGELLNTFMNDRKEDKIKLEEKITEFYKTHNKPIMTLTSPSNNVAPVKEEAI